MQIYEHLFESHGVIVAQALLSRRDILDREGYLNVRNTLLALLELKVVPIVNENDVVAVDELGDMGFGDNDTLSAMVANLIDADLLIVLSDIGGLYTADPHEDPHAQLIPRVEVIDDAITALAGHRHSARSRGGMRAKLEAIKLASASGVASSLAGGRTGRVVQRLASGEAVGTYFAPTASKMESRKRWAAQPPLYARPGSGGRRGGRSPAGTQPEPASRRCEGGGGRLPTRRYHTGG